jgi:two-component system response regulator NreC
MPHLSGDSREGLGSNMRGDDNMTTPGSLAQEILAYPAAEHALVPVVVTGGNGWNLRRLRRYFTQENGFILVEGYPPAEQLLSQCQRLAPCILLAGEAMISGMQSMDLAGLVDFGRNIKVLAYGAVHDDRTVQRLLRMGCMGFIEENAPPAMLKKAVRAVANGEIWVGRKLLTRILQQLLFATRSPRLTRREREILRWIAKGYSNHAIAEKLCISHETVRWHIRSLHAKLGLQDRPGTALFARQYLEGESQEDAGGG